MKRYCILILFGLCAVLSGCSTIGLGGSVESSATYVSKSSEATAVSKSTASSNQQSRIDMKVNEIKREKDSKLINKYIRKGF